MSDHPRHRDDVGAYLLGALDDLERQDFERHLRGCDECQDQLERLRPAAEALPGSVEQLAPPPGLKRRLMAEVEPARRKPNRSLLAVAAALVIALAVAVGVTQLGGGDETRTVTATVAKAIPHASGRLDIRGEHATLRLHDMPRLGGTRVYQVWIQHGDRMIPARTFEVGSSGAGDVLLPNVRNADGVYVTREDHGGARVPSEDPIVSVPL